MECLGLSLKIIVFLFCFSIIVGLYFIQPAQPPRARGGLFTDLTIYLYGGTSADLVKIPPFLGESLFAFPGKNDQYKKVGA